MSSTSLLPDIAQAPTQDGTTLLWNLVGISKKVRVLLSLGLAQLDLHPGQDEYLVAMEKDVPRSVSSIAELLNVRPSTVVKMTDKLVASGYLRRHSSRNDLRTIFVSITSLGHDRRSEVLALYDRLEAEFVRDLGSDRSGPAAARLGEIDDMLKRLVTRVR